MDGGPIPVSPTARLYISFELIFSAFPIGSPISQEDHRVTYISQHATMLRYDTQTMLTLLPQDYMKKGTYSGNILGGQMHKQLNSKRHITMVSANLNALIQKPSIWWFLAGVF